MNSPTITMERKAAVQKLEEYEAAVKANPRACRELDRGILVGYRVLARGGRLVDVNDAIKAGGLNLAGLPRLAIARGHVTHTEWRRDGTTGGGTFAWLPERISWWSHQCMGKKWRWSMPAGTFDGTSLSSKDVRAVTPLVPLPLRPRYKLENYFLLWEANWHPAPPRDPYLLRPLAGSLMEIIAEWELTDLEVAAVSGAMRTAR